MKIRPKKLRGVARKNPFGSHKGTTQQPEKLERKVISLFPLWVSTSQVFSATSWLQNKLQGTKPSTILAINSLLKSGKVREPDTGPKFFQKTYLEGNEKNKNQHCFLHKMLRTFTEMCGFALAELPWFLIKQLGLMRVFEVTLLQMKVGGYPSYAIIVNKFLSVINNIDTALIIFWSFWQAKVKGNRGEYLCFQKDQCSLALGGSSDLLE